MNLELVKKLREIGYPHEWVICWDESENFPTLTQLINACGDEFYSLSKKIDGTFLAFDKPINHRGLFAPGSTPEEAVANLWLALHKGN